MIDLPTTFKFGPVFSSLFIISGFFFSLVPFHGVAATQTRYLTYLHNPTPAPRPYRGPSNGLALEADRNNLFVNRFHRDGKMDKGRRGDRFVFCISMYNVAILHFIA